MYFHDIADVLHELEMRQLPEIQGEGSRIEFYCGVCKLVIEAKDVYGGDE